MSRQKTVRETFRESYNPGRLIQGRDGGEGWAERGYNPSRLTEAREPKPPRNVSPRPQTNAGAKPGK